MTIKELILSFLFTFSVTFDFLKVAIKRPVVFEPKPLIVSSLPPEFNENLSWESSSVLPSDLVRTYLSSSNSRKTSSLPDEIVFVELSVMVTSYCFLIIKLAPVKSTDSTFFFGNGWKSAESKIVLELLWNLDDTIFKSLTSISEPGRVPSHIPVTVVTGDITTELVNTSLTLAKDFEVKFGLLYCKRFPVVTIPGKESVALVIVETPAEEPVIDTAPSSPTSFWIISPANVFAVPTTLNKDFTSDRPCAVYAVPILVSFVPSKINFSPLIKVPLIWYTVIPRPADTGCLTKATAPLELPFTLEGTERVIGSLIVRSAYVCKSNKEISQRFNAWFSSSYEPASNAKSYTLATPISFPGGEVETIPILSFLRLITDEVLIPIEGEPLTLLRFNVDPKLNPIDWFFNVLVLLDFGASIKDGAMVSISYPLTYAFPGETL